MAVNKVRLTIGGTEYSILAEDDVKYVQSLGKELDKSFTKIMKSNTNLSTTQAAVLLALDYADECKKAVATADRLREQIKDYLDDASDAKSKADWARHEAEALKKEAEKLRLENGRLKAELKAVLDSAGK
ncbi:MAG: cell division protein ZapA [Clostridia bacterium]|nr:cell division protein ZapA [Clostridia bacterium]